MRFSLSDQTLYFAASIVLGAILAAAYDIVRAVRLLLRAGRALIFVSDVVFFALCGVITSLFALPFNKGDVRAFVLFGELVGFLTYRLTIGSVTGKIYADIARFLRHFIKKICEKIKVFFDFLLKAGAVLVYNVHEIIDKIQNVVYRRSRRRAAERACRRRKNTKEKVYERKENQKKKRRGNARGRHRRRER